MHPKRVLSIAGLCLAAGCHSYAPTRVESLAPGQEVRVHITPAEARRLEEVRRTGDRVMEGTYQGSSGLRVVVRTPVSRSDPMAGMRALAQTVEVPIDQVVEIEEKSLDRLRTGALIAGLAVGAVWGVIIATGNIDSGGSGTPPPPPDQSRVPSLRILRLPVPW